MSLTLLDKTGYNGGMVAASLAFVLRMALIAAVWMFVWRLVKPHSKAFRIVRAALLVFILLVVLATLRAAGI